MAEKASVDLHLLKRLYSESPQEENRQSSMEEGGQEGAGTNVEKAS